MIEARARGRRLTDALVGLATWIAAIGVALLFYDWISRWYVAAAVVVGFVVVALINGRAPSAPEAVRRLALLPAPRSPEPQLDLELDLDPDGDSWLSPEELPA